MILTHVMKADAGQDNPFKPHYTATSYSARRYTPNLREEPRSMVQTNGPFYTYIM